MGKLINSAFDKAGMSFVPVAIRYILVALILLSPILAVLFMMCQSDDESPVATAAAKKVA